MPRRYTADEVAERLRYAEFKEELHPRDEEGKFAEKRTAATISTSDYSSVKPYNFESGNFGDNATGDVIIGPGQAMRLKKGPYAEAVIRVPYDAPSKADPERATYIDIPEAKFEKLAKRFGEEGRPFSDLPLALLAGHGTDKNSTDRVEDYLKSPTGSEVLAANPGDADAKRVAADAFEERGHQHHAASLRLDAAKQSLVGAEAQLKAFRKTLPGYGQSAALTEHSDNQMTEEQQREQFRLVRAAQDAISEMARAERAHRESKPASPKTPKPKSPSKSPDAVSLTGNTYAVRDQLAKIPGAKYDRDKKRWTVPAEHAAQARKIVSAAPPADDLLKKSNVDLAELGLVKVSGPKGPYVRKATKEELHDIIDYRMQGQPRRYSEDECAAILRR